MNTEQAKSTLGGNLLVIKASAGSGKTYTLARLYIELLLLKPDGHGRLELRNAQDYHRHILAITFTNKATDEMKHRIVKELHQLATHFEKSDYRSYFEQMCTPEAFQELSQAAQKALTAILMNYSMMNVSTIDAFFQSILRNFARELDRDYSYEVQIDEDFAIGTAVHNFLLSLGTDAERINNSQQLSTVEGWVRDFIHRNVEQDNGWNFFGNNKLTDLAKKIKDEEFRKRMQDIREYLTLTDDNGVTRSNLTRIRQFRELAAKARDHHKNSYTTGFATALPLLLQRHGIDKDKLNKAKSLYKFMWVNAMKDGKEPTKGMNAINRDNVHEQFKGDTSTLPTALLDEAMAMVNDLVNTFCCWQLLDKLVADVGLLGLIGEIDLKLEQYRKDNNVVLIADTNDLINHLVAGNNTVPFVYERVGTWINHFMIDEFQDTSHKQYDNFVPLLHESLSHGGNNFNLIIGDAKQSIYRFRNADPSLFRDCINKEFEQQLRLANLPTNFRSLEAVVTFNNRLFKLLVDHYTGAGDTVSELVSSTYKPTNHDSDYQQLVHKQGGKYAPGYVRVLAKTSTGDDYNTDLVLSDLPDYLLELHQRFPWSKIGILVNLTDEGTKIVHTILEHNKQHAHEPDQQIRITSDEAMRLNNSPTVRRIISILRFIDLVQFATEDEDASPAEDDTNPAEGDTAPTADPKEQLVKALRRKRVGEQRHHRVLNNFLSAIGGKENLEAQEVGRILDQCFTSHDNSNTGNVEERMSRYALMLEQLLPDPRTHLLTLTSIVEHIIQLIAQEQHHLRETAFLLALQNHVTDFANHNSGGTVREFLRYWDQNNRKFNIASSAGEDAITVMTIHKAKGLEFECVVIPFANWQMDDSDRENQYWITKDAWTAQHGSDLFTSAGTELPHDVIPPMLPVDKKWIRKLAERNGTLAPFVGSHLADLLIDNLGKTYVALTRPRMELHLFISTPNKKNSNITTIDQVLNQMVSKVEGMAALEGRGWHMGTPRPFKQDDDSDQPLTMPSYYVTPAPGKVTVRLPHDSATPKSKGRQLHNVMERIRYQRDATKALNRAEQRGVFTEPWTRQCFEDILHSLFTHPVTAPWFADDNMVYNERSLVGLPPEDKETPDSQAEQANSDTRRPDRVVRRPDGSLIVVDYKFGLPHRIKHTEQVQRYVQHLADITGAPTQGFLVYIAPGKPPRVMETREEVNK